MKGELYVVGLGPGDPALMTGQARAALEKAEVLCGYTVYVDLVRDLYPDKEVYTTPMRGEMERCRWALQTADAGRTVAMVCSGDAGVYGMASPVLELAAQYPQVGIEVVPGVTAALAGAAVLGAPLGHDFCCISLSDLLTPWPLIEKRLRCAAEGDFALCLYNPASHRRTGHLQRAVELLLQAGKALQTPCATVRSIARPGQEVRHYTLAELGTAPADMFTTVFVGSSTTVRQGDRLITPRGYAAR